ncbi:MAG: DNA damage-inducible protein D [Candidatus Melainabacteria bacterium RIFCSPHIGHO2_02_FULL_34_12]|nr:MAG: DNA damage-inducible protein D [Candidatus Melainabacteria bacterium RIFCSPHIGHO2_02_FULL_34_12]
MGDIEKISKSTFESIKKINEYGQEYWSSRDLSKVLGYTDYRNFIAVITKAKDSCKNSGQKVSDHFVDINEMVQIGSGAERELDTIHLSRYACYLIVQNADPSKEIVALGQTYFAVQTRKQEIIESKKYQELKTEDEKRLFLRNEMKAHNKTLAATAKEAGVIEAIDYAIFQDHGYKGLYGGLGSKGIHKKRELKEGQQILDHMGSTELAANLFRATQTEEKIRRENIKGKEKANQTHFEVGLKVRKTIKEIGGEMPENLPVVESIKKIERKNKKRIK